MAQEQMTAIVTGASSGIGSASARAFALRGVNVLINYAGNSEGAEATAAACRDAGVDAMVMQGDVSSDEVCQAIAAAALERWGRVDVLVNNAGTTKSADPKDLSQLSAEDFERIYRVNVIGCYQMTRAAAAALKARGGSIVNTSSIAGITGMGSSIAYAASKGAMNAMTLALARSLAPEVRVNAVCPGFVDSEWWNKQHDPETIEKLRDRARSVTLLGQVVTSEDVAEAVLHFALGARSTTGQLHVVDNGLSLNIGQPVRV